MRPYSESAPPHIPPFTRKIVQIARSKDILNVLDEHGVVWMWNRQAAKWQSYPTLPEGSITKESDINYGSIY